MIELKGNIVTIDGIDYDEYAIKTKTQTATVREYIVTTADIAEQEKRQRIYTLKEIITNKNFLGEVVTTEQTELKTLLEVSEYITVESQIQSAIDDYTLSLIEGGVI